MTSPGQKYNRDLFVLENDGTHWVVEVKMEKVHHLAVSAEDDELIDSLVAGL